MPSWARSSKRSLLAAAAALLLFFAAGGTGLAAVSRAGALRAVAAETRPIREGTLEVAIADNFDAGSSRTHYSLLTPEGERIPLRFEGAGPRAG